MIDYTILDKMNEICSWMEDDISKIILKQRLLHSLTGDIQYIYDMLDKTGFSLDALSGMYESEVRDMYEDLFPQEDLLSWMLHHRDEKIVVVGCGANGAAIKQLLDFAKLPIEAFADNYKEGNYLGHEIIKMDEIAKDAAIVISSYLYRDDMLQQLKSLGYEEKQIFYPGTNALFCPTGVSYFDEAIFKPQEEAIFIDGGCFHGETAIKFAEWTQSYEKIIAFEPDAVNYQVCVDKFEKLGLKNVTVVQAGMWSKDAQLHLDRIGDDGSGARITEAEGETVEVRSLDAMLGDEKVSFIKLDIEGAELEALKGASKIIQRDTPRMAICIYHKPEDIWEIPQYIKELVPEYHMAVRHYMTYLYDTVLYCWKD